MKKNYFPLLVVIFLLCSNTYSQIDPYAWANKCYELTFQLGSRTKPLDFGSGNNAFFLKPAALGEYLLYGADDELLTIDGGVRLVSTASANENSIWLIEDAGNDKLYLKHKDSGKYLYKRGWPFSLFTGPSTYWITSYQSRAIQFTFTEVENCSVFPEAELNAEGDVQTGLSVNAPVRGIADIHSHIASYTSFNTFFNAGKLFSPYGIEDALGTCEGAHGKFGNYDLLSTINDAVEGFGFNPFHDSTGYPSFEFWPSHLEYTHQKAYYQWLNRARLGGLRIITVLSIQNEVLTKIQNDIVKKARLISPELNRPSDDIDTSMEAHDLMVQEMKALEAYVDAQEGGPGKGWLKIVTSPEQAREVIRQGKLAVVLGMEIEAPFNCIDGGQVDVDCSRAYISAQLEKYKDKGISHIFPQHHWDNDFGGAYYFNTSIEISNILFNGNEIEWQPIEEPRTTYSNYKPIVAIGSDSFVDLPDFLDSLLASILSGVFSYEVPELPESESGFYENKQGLSPTGQIFIEELMKRGVMIDLAHTSRVAVEEIYEIMDRFDYPPLYSHTSTYEDLSSVFERDGVVSPGLSSNRPADQFEVERDCRYSTSTVLMDRIVTAAEYLQDAKPDFAGIPLTSDYTGAVLSTLGPRFNDEANPCDVPQSSRVTYPFTNEDGSIVFEKQKTGDRVFDINEDGMAHIGMLPDFIEDLRVQGYSEDEIDVLYGGAEEYLRHWERCIAASKSVTSTPGLERPFAYAGKESAHGAHKAQRMDTDLYEKIVENYADEMIEQVLQKENQLANGGENAEALVDNNDSSAGNGEIRLYPTLIENTFSVESKDIPEVKIEIFDFAGKLIYEDIHGNNKNVEGLFGVTSGIYFVRVSDMNSDDHVVVKVVKK